MKLGNFQLLAQFHNFTLRSIKTLRVSSSIRFHSNLPKPPNVVEDKNFKQVLTEALTKELEISRNSATDMINNYSALQTLPQDIMTKNIQILLKNEVSSVTIMNYPRLLSQNNLEAKIYKLRNLPYKLNDTIYLACLPLYRLEKVFRNLEPLEERIDVFAKSLKVDVAFITRSMAEKPFLLTKSLQRVKRMLKILLTEGISKESIINDWWVLAYTPQLTEERIEWAKKHNIKELKTWMIRCQRDIIQKHVQRRTDNKAVLGDHTLLEYLCERLQCPMEEAKGMLARAPALKKKNMKRIEQMIELLCANGFTAQDIVRIPKILLHSVETTQNRIQDLEKENVKMYGLHVLAKSKKQFKQFINIVKRCRIERAEMKTN